jgi:hypothetical protein
MAIDPDLYVTDPDFQRTIPYFNIRLFIVFDQAACWARGKTQPMVDVPSPVSVAADDRR